MFTKSKLAQAVRGALILMPPFLAALAHGAESIEEIVVVGITPGAAARQALTKVPYAVQSTLAADLENARALDVSDYLNNRLASVSINSAQNNP
ncbi:MAG: hypothetical protein ACTS5G_03490, partial [Burkholderiales bacterium]